MQKDEKFDFGPFRKALELSTRLSAAQKFTKEEREQCKQAFKQVRQHARNREPDFRRVISTLIREAKPGTRNIAVGYHLLGTDVHEWLMPAVHFEGRRYDLSTSIHFDLSEVKILWEMGLPQKVTLALHRGAICWAVFTSIPY